MAQIIREFAERFCGLDNVWHAASPRVAMNPYADAANRRGGAEPFRGGFDANLIGEPAVGYPPSRAEQPNRSIKVSI
jgi:hypothetical protein